MTDLKRFPRLEEIFRQPLPSPLEWETTFGTRSSLVTFSTSIDHHGEDALKSLLQVSYLPQLRSLECDTVSTRVKSAALAQSAQPAFLAPW